MQTSVPWSRGVATGLAALSLALSLAVARPARADTPAGDAAGSAQNLRRLDIMLMVTGLRCRNTADDFQADFSAFEARHLLELNAANHELVARYAAQMSADDASRLVDRLSTQMANRYGNGHPWLGCHELKGLAQALAAQDGRDVLVQAAREVLDGDESSPQVALSTKADASVRVAAQ